MLATVKQLETRELRIAVEDIQAGVSTLELICKPEEIDLESEGIYFTSPVIARLDIFRQGDIVFVKGEFTIDIRLECARCLNPVQRTLSGTLENQYQPLPKMARDRMDDIGIGYYSEDFIDFSDDFRESFLLEFPTRLLCSEDCKGLCSKCGQNLNERTCKCYLEPEEAQTSKFAELIKTLKVNKKVGGVVLGSSEEKNI